MQLSRGCSVGMGIERTMMGMLLKLLVKKKDCSRDDYGVEFATKHARRIDKRGCRTMFLKSRMVDEFDGEVCRY